MTNCNNVKFKDFEISEFFLEMYCDRGEGGVRCLTLRGNDLIKKIGRRIADHDLVRIVIFLRKHLEVLALEFPYNEISDCGISILADFFKEGPAIRHLNLIGNNIGARGIGYLTQIAEIIPLHSLRLSGNKFGSEGAKDLSKLLTSESTLKFLDVSDTDQTMSGLAYLMTMLMPARGGTKSLEYVDLGRPLPQPLHQVGNAHAAEFVSQVIQDNNILKEIHVQQYGFDFRDMEILLEGLSANTTLLCLDLNNNNIGDDGVEYLCKYLRTSPTLECLMIGANNFSDHGAVALSFNLPFSKIKLLDVTNNRITDEGMMSIFHSIKKTVAMRALFLWGNKISHKSLVFLQQLFNSGLLDPEHTDVKLFCDEELKAAWNPQANRYTQRFYCVSDYGQPLPRKIGFIPPPPFEKPFINFRHHVDDTVLGLPFCQSTVSLVETKYYD